MNSFGLLNSNRAANQMGQFIGTIQRGTKEIQGDLTSIKNMLAGGILTDEGIVGGISEVLQNIDDKTMLVLGKMTSGGIGLDEWKLGTSLSRQDVSTVNMLNQHFSEFSRMNLYGPKL